MNGSELDMCGMFFSEFFYKLVGFRVGYTYVVQGDAVKSLLTGANLPVRYLERSMDFYTQMGFTNKPQFSDDQSKCMVWNETILVMLMSYEKLCTFMSKQVADTKTSIGSWFALLVESFEELNEFSGNGLKAGGTEPTPMKDYGFIQLRNLEDLDGHMWEIFF